MKKLTYLSSIVALIFLTAFGCENESLETPYQSEGIIYSKNMALCVCCGGYYIIIDSTKQIFQKEILPENNLDLTIEKLPMYVMLDWEFSSQNCGSSIAIKRISKSNNCVDEFVDYTTLEQEYGWSDTMDYRINLPVGKFEIIRTQNDFDNLDTSINKTKIDFTKYDLIIGRKGLTYTCYYIDYMFIRNCQTNSLELIVFLDIPSYEKPKATIETYNVLVPKLKEDEQVNVKTILRAVINKSSSSKDFSR